MTSIFKKRRDESKESDNYLKPHLACDAIRLKCTVRETVHKMLMVRHDTKGKDLGSIGPVVFETVGTWLKRFEPSKNEKMFTSFYGKKLALQKDNVDEIIVIGDIHGDLLSFLTALVMGGVIDARGDYIPAPPGRSRMVIQTGDLIDRRIRSSDKATSTNGREEIDLMQFVYLLDRHARHVKDDNTRIVSVCGNHDAYNMDFEAFKSIRESFWTDVTVKGFGGRQGRRDFFRTGSHVGRYMAWTRPILVRIGDWVFTHGGVDLKKMQKFADAHPTSLASRDPEPGAALVVLVNDVYAALMTRDESTLAQFAAEEKSPGTTGDAVGNSELKANEMPPALCALMECRKQGKADAGSESCSADTMTIGDMFGVGRAWRSKPEPRGGLCISHTPMTYYGLSATCGDVVWRVDAGLSEAFGRKDKLKEGLLFQILRIRPKTNRVSVITAPAGGEGQKEEIYRGWDNAPIPQGVTKGVVRGKKKK